MRTLSILLLLFPLLCFGESFEGTWILDTRTTQQKQDANYSCGVATFELHQIGKDIVGTHSFYLPDCSRINEGGSVVGEVKGLKAYLYVTSGRNGAIVKGIATLKNEELNWFILRELQAGDIEGDSPLILSKGIFKREKSYGTN